MANDDMVKVDVYLECYQRDWLQTLGEDLRSDLSAAVRVIVDAHLEAHDANPIYPQIPMVLHEFKSLVTNTGSDGYTRGAKLLEQLNIYLEIAKKEDEIKTLRRELEYIKNEKS